MIKLRRPNHNPRWFGVSLWDEEPIALRNFDVKPGEVFFDVGASDSYWTVYAATRGALVYAFEPSIPQFRILNESLIKEAVFEQCRCFMMGLDKVDRVRTLEAWYESWGGPGFDVSEDCRVQTRFIPMDFFLPELKRLDWVKIDVEGGEFDVMQGGQELIDKYRPSFIIENHQGVPRIGEWMRANHIVEKIYDFLRERDYEIHEDTCHTSAERSYIIARPRPT